MQIDAVPVVGPGHALPVRAHFLEHVGFVDGCQSTPVVLCGSDRRIHVSEDLGQSWVTHDFASTVRAPITRSFTLRNGNRLLQTSREGVQTVLVDPTFKVISVSEHGCWNWHGSWSIDECKSGVIIYGEYAAQGDFLHIWRSTDGGVTWQSRMKLRGLGSERPEIRHFHVCQADPFSLGAWIISSGDSPEHCRIWLSSDEGESWSEVGPPRDMDDGVGSSRRRRLYRFTALAFQPDQLLWVTDDTLGVGRAGLVVAPRTSIEEARVVAPLGKDELRTLTLLGDRSAIATSESKADAAMEAQVFHIHGEQATCIRILANRSGGKSGFSRSMCSRVAHEGVFFSYDDGGVVAPNCRFVRWTFSPDRESTHPNRDGPSAERVVASSDAESASKFLGCNLCQPEMQAGIDAGIAARRNPESSDACYVRLDGVPVDYKCEKCDSRGRTRALATLLSEARKFLPEGGHALGVSSSKVERRLVSRYFRSLTHVSLHGDHGDDACLVGVDITSMPSILSNSFDFYCASCVLDYIPDLPGVFREARRVLRPGGVMAFSIQPYRLRFDDETTVVVRHHDALRHEAYARRSGSAHTGIPDCVFSVPWLLRTAHELGLSVQSYPFRDPISDLTFSWFLGRAEG